MRLACLAALLLCSGCVYDLLDDDTYNVGQFDINDVTGTYTGERIFEAPGQTGRTAAVVTVQKLDVNAVLIQIEFDGLVDEYVGTYSSGGAAFYGDIQGGGSFSWSTDGDGYIMGRSTDGRFNETSRYTGRLVRDAFDLLIRSPDGTIRNDLRTSR